jgi:hypothetical protein
MGEPHMGIQIKDGTPAGGESLCNTCLYGHVERGFRETEQVVICETTYPSHRVAFRVRDCSGYTERKRQTLKQMEDMALVLERKGYKRKVGFVPLEELTEDEPEFEFVVQDVEID